MHPDICTFKDCYFKFFSSLHDDFEVDKSNISVDSREFFHDSLHLYNLDSFEGSPSSDALENFLPPEILEFQEYFDMKSLFEPYQWDGKAVTSHWSYRSYDYASQAKSIKKDTGKWDELVEAAWERQAMIEDEMQYSYVEKPELPEYIEHYPESAWETSSNRPFDGKGIYPYESTGNESCEFCRRRKGKVHFPHFITSLI